MGAWGIHQGVPRGKEGSRVWSQGRRMARILASALAGVQAHGRPARYKKPRQKAQLGRLRAHCPSDTLLTYPEGHRREQQLVTSPHLQLQTSVHPTPCLSADFSESEVSLVTQFNKHLFSLVSQINKHLCSSPCPKPAAPENSRGYYKHLESSWV